jgi:hypothetical protein
VRMEISRAYGVTTVAVMGERLLKEVFVEGQPREYFYNPNFAWDFNTKAPLDIILPLRKHRNPKKRRAIENLGFAYSQAIEYGSAKEKARIIRKLKRQMKKNPTPMLRRMRAEARYEIGKEGWREAYKMATYIAKSCHATGDVRGERRWKLQARMILRMKETVKKHRVVKTMYDKLLAEFPPVSPMEARGFILEDGSCLNLGQYDDHRIINCVYRDTRAAEEKYGSRYGAFVNLCKKYSMIRWIPETKQCEVFVEPTRDQISAMRELAENGMLKSIEVWKRGQNSILEAEDADTLVAGVEAVYA